ncbi:ATP dependent DNA ligase [Cyathus striatus]|nr:ATP dependent DNA ligase [Cyathus striatus]
MSIKLAKTEGVLALVGTRVDELARVAIQSDTLNPTYTKKGPFHITVITKDEIRNISSQKLNQIYTDTQHVFSAGLGGKAKAGVFFVVIVWAAGQQLRKQLGLPSKQFHITLSVHDDHSMDKSIRSLLPGQIIDESSPDFLDHLAYTLHVSGQYHEAVKYASQLAVLTPSSHRGFLRMADVALWNKEYKLAMLSYASSYECADQEKVRAYCIKKLIECSKETEWGAVCQTHEMDQIPTNVRAVLLEPWSAELRGEVSNTNVTPSLCLEPRHSLYVPTITSGLGSELTYKLPRFFRWLVPYHIAIMSTPRHEEDILALSSPHLGIRHVLTLTEETPLPNQWHRGKPITNTYLPIPNYHPPSIEQMDLVMRLIDDEDKLPILIHCGGGKGRAGTVAACYLAAYGFSKPYPNQTHPALSASEAISLLRAIRPGSIETSQQEAFVSKWCSAIWKRQSIHPDLPSEPPPCAMEIEGNFGPDHDLFMLVGLPGSGKSWFSKALVARNPSRWVYISQDESGSRASCEAALGKARSHVLLDRCNTAASDRKLWLELASNWSQSPLCIWFDYSRDLCISRAQMRAGHPTLPPGSRVRNAVSQMDKIFVRPSLNEGFKAILIVRSFTAAEELVLRLSPPVTIYKFPRTPHIFNMGAATTDDVVLEGPSIVTTSGTRVVITEKIDGANMGFSLSSSSSEIVVQNRSHYVNSQSHEQFKKLGAWIESHRDDLLRVLNRDPHFAQRYILFGEWMFATHSIHYTRLPDHFIAFDLYDRSTNTWVDRRTLSGLLLPTSIPLTPVLHEGPMPTEIELKHMIQQQSQFCDEIVEGVYIKLERDSQVIDRAKLVRSDFIAGNEHWTRGGIRPNSLSIGS